MKQLEVQIMQQSYLLSCPDGRESRMLEAVERVDTAMCKIRDAGKLKARERIAVLAALNLAFELGELSLQQPMPCLPPPPHMRPWPVVTTWATTPGSTICCCGSTRRWATTASCSESALALRAMARLVVQWSRLLCSPGFIFP